MADSCRLSAGRKWNSTYTYIMSSVGLDWTWTLDLCSMVGHLVRGTLVPERIKAHMQMHTLAVST